MALGSEIPLYVRTGRGLVVVTFGFLESRRGGWSTGGWSRKQASGNLGRRHVKLGRKLLDYRPLDGRRRCGRSLGLFVPQLRVPGHRRFRLGLGNRSLIRLNGVRFPYALKYGRISRIEFVVVLGFGFEFVVAFFCHY